jgi:ABC-type nitrate/sulfonate/bicarbonate transport system permease component
VLGFLTVTVTAFINLFPGSELGLEFASIFAIFTAMAWNMTFAFYHSLISQPRDLDEAARIMRLTKWERFWRLDVPSGMIPLVWNGMMSFGGAWFFLAASESISVLNHTYALPGIGSYVAAAIAQSSLSHVGIAIGVMIVLVIGVNFLFWRPMVAWAERFRTEESAAAERPRSVVLDLLRRSSVPDLVSRPARPVGRALDKITRPFGLAEHPLQRPAVRVRTGDVFFAGAVTAVVVYGAWRAPDYLQGHGGLGQFGPAFLYGLATFGRVVVLLIVASVVWVPIGVWIGMNPRVSWRKRGTRCDNPGAGDPAGQGRDQDVHDAGRARPERRQPGSGHGVPVVRVAALAHRAAERGTGHGGPRGARGGAARQGAERDRPDRAGRVRVRLSEGAVRGHAPAGRLRPRAGRPAGRAADGRAVLRAGRADRGQPAH